MIWLASFPRSGNSLAAEILASAGYFITTIYKTESDPIKVRGLHGQFVKTHERFSCGESAFIIVRDPRDVLCSFAQYRNVTHEEALRELTGFTGWFDYWRTDSNYAVFKYEDMLLRPDEIVTLALTRINPEFKEREMRPFEELHRLDPGHYLKGRANRWGSELSQPLVEQVIKDHRQFMEEFGYL